MAYRKFTAGFCRWMLVLAMGSCCAPALTAVPVSAKEVPVGGTLPHALMSGLNGPDRNLSFFAERPLIINVWASWCGPCRMEMASLERLAWSAEASDFVVIGISTDDLRPAAMAFLRQSNASFNHYIDANLELETMLGASHLPLTVLVDAHGRIVKKIYGAQEWDSPQFKRMVRRALTKP
jgi:thiol-disulfide isomerase/thioredoxin